MSVPSLSFIGGISLCSGLGKLLHIATILVFEDRPLLEEHSNFLKCLLEG